MDSVRRVRDRAGIAHGIIGVPGQYKMLRCCRSIAPSFVRGSRRLWPLLLGRGPAGAARAESGLGRIPLYYAERAP
jgi:hypothetical protein